MSYYELENFDVDRRHSDTDVVPEPQKSEKWRLLSEPCKNPIISASQKQNLTRKRGQDGLFHFVQRF